MPQCLHSLTFNAPKSRLHLVVVLAEGGRRWRGEQEGEGQGCRGRGVESQRERASGREGEVERG